MKPFNWLISDKIVFFIRWATRVSKFETTPTKPSSLPMVVMHVLVRSMVRFCFGALQMAFARKSFIRNTRMRMFLFFISYLSFSFPRTMVTSVAWHPEGRYVASCEKHRQVILWSDWFSFFLSNCFFFFVLCLHFFVIRSAHQKK